MKLPVGCSVNMPSVERTVIKEQNGQGKPSYVFVSKSRTSVFINVFIILEKIEC